MLRTIFELVANVDATSTVRRVQLALIDFALAGAAFVVGLGFLVAAGYIYAASHYGALNAALGFGAGFIVLSALIILIHEIRVTRRKRRRAEEARADQLRSLATATMMAAVPTLLRSSGKIGTVVLPVAAVMAYAIYKENTRPRRDDVDPELRD